MYSIYMFSLLTNTLMSFPDSLTSGPSLWRGFVCMIIMTEIWHYHWAYGNWDECSVVATHCPWKWLCGHCQTVGRQLTSVTFIDYTVDLPLVVQNCINLERLSIVTGYTAKLITNENGTYIDEHPDMCYYRDHHLKGGIHAPRVYKCRPRCVLHQKLNEDIVPLHLRGKGRLPNIIRDVAVHTRLGPDHRVNDLYKFIQTIGGKEEVKRELTGWGLTFSNDLVRAQGHSDNREGGSQERADRKSANQIPGLEKFWKNVILVRCSGNVLEFILDLRKISRSLTCAPDGNYRGERRKY